MNAQKWGRKTAFAIICGVAVSVALGASTGTAGAAPVMGVHSSPAAKPLFRQLIGHVVASGYFEASAPVAGSYAIEYDVTKGIVYYDTLVDEVGLGSVGGPAGTTNRTQPTPLTAGGHLVNVAGGEGAGEADLYLVQIS
ncbi:hypothetical protein OG943_05935 [Amycolatopsis sp. NBC_00345]|uniref:hypothetical protein n=1 Tax=Amycolatopsis sp. NBC_00345 TaxID=2975955 RepID=UPI002E2677A8